MPCAYLCNPFAEDAAQTVDVVQLVRTSDCDSEGRGFESHHSPEIPASAGIFVFHHFHADITALFRVTNRFY
jgi:hypothetical protein